MKYESNYVKAAVTAVGGPTRVANKIGVSSSTVHAWIKADRVPNFDRAEMLASLAKVSATRLRGAE
jgi:DNA-binding transcriptional regulator YdaS (Cro superfamily)